jgi:hypothetical protein
MRKKSKKALKESTAKAQDSTPMMISDASSSSQSSSRRNIAGSIERTDRFKNIDDGLVPFKINTGYGSGESTIDIKDAIILCQKAYYNFSQFRNVIDMMTEFSVSNIYLKGGSAKSREFFEALFKKINILSFQDKFFREYYRSGNVFTYRFDAVVQPSDLAKITQIFGARPQQYIPQAKPLPAPTDKPLKKIAPVAPSAEPEGLKLPVRYIILNPADVRLLGTANFGIAIYQKILTEYELMRLRYPQTPEDEELYQSLPDDTKRLIENKKMTFVPLFLQPGKMYITFYKKQDYEPFAVPMGFPVLEDINYKYELKKMDMAISRTMQQMILLVTAGTDPEKGGINQKNLDALRKLFENQSVGRVLVADYTTKAEFVIPQIAEILDPKKYEVVDRDINNGLNNILLGEGKFANQMQKTDVFLARLAQARQTFLNDFLFPEIKRISQELGFKSYPTPYFEDFFLKDNAVRSKVFTRLMELGILTPEEGLRAIESNVLPTKEENEANQEEYKNLREKGFYYPLIGASAAEPGPSGQAQPKGISGGSPNAGRPSGSGGSPQGAKTVGPIGSNASEELFSLTKIKENMVIAQNLDKEVESHLKKKFKIKKLNDAQKEVAESICSVIMANENPEKWTESIATYCEKPVDSNPERVKAVDEIAAQHGVNNYLASLLFVSKKDK